jgi:uncharacterized damage-inducible protein DinB
VLDGVDVDSGTAAEIGYAFARGKPIVGYRGDLRLAADDEALTVNLQVEYFIRASGGDIVATLGEIPGALAALDLGQWFRCASTIMQRSNDTANTIRVETQMQASLVGTYRAMAHNNAWANHRLLSACFELPQQDFVGARTGFFPSIAATLNHILIIDLFYVDALEGGSLGPKAWADRMPCATAQHLMREQAAVDARLLAHCNGLTEAHLDSVVSVNRDTRVQTERRDRLLLHLFQHQTHHRGQAHAMLAGTTRKPPQLDEFFSAAEARLRAAEFAELGWTEGTVWGQ